MKKLIKISMIVLIIFIVILTSIFYKSIKVENYIKENNSFDLIDVNNYDVFLNGENHTMGKSDKFKLEFFTYLNKKAKVKNIIEEMGFSSGLLLNEYIQSGNEKYLDSFMNQVKGTMAYTKEKYEFYKLLYEYNSQLDEDSKINIYGIDIERNAIDIIKAMEILIDNNKFVPKSLKKSINLVREENKAAIKFLKLAYEEDKEDCEEYFGDEFIYFENIIKNLYPSGGGEDFRDKIMMRNFSFVYSINEGEKFFGQFGSEHIYQDYMNSDTLIMEEVRFATLLNGDSSPVKNKVYSLLCVYKNEEGNSPSNDFLNYNLFRNIKSDTFIELSGEDSPFVKKECLFKSGKEENVTCDYIQGLMILKDSQKTHTYNK